VTVLRPFDSPEALELELRRRRAVSVGIEPMAGEIREEQGPQRNFLRKGQGKQAANFGLQFHPHAASGRERKVAPQRHVNAVVAARGRQSKGFWKGREITRQEPGDPPSAMGAVY